MRADGTVRRARKIRPGYVPQEDVPKYVPRAKRQGNEGAILKGRSDDLADSLAKLSLNKETEKEQGSEKSEKQEKPESERKPRRMIVDPAEEPTNEAKPRSEVEKKPRRMIVDPEQEPKEPKSGQSQETAGEKTPTAPERKPRRMVIDPSQEPETIQRSSHRTSQFRTQTTVSDSERRPRRMIVDEEAPKASRPAERKPTPESSGKYIPPWKRGS